MIFMKYAFPLFFFLFPNWPSPPPPPPPLMIMTNLLPRKDSFQSILALQKKYHISAYRSILLREEHNLPPGFDITSMRQVTLDQLKAFHEEKKKDPVIPPFHVYSRFHHDYIYQRYSEIVPYSVYCTVEEDIAKLILHLMNEPDPDPFLFIVQKQEWFFEESFQSFLTSEEKKKIDTTLMIDLDARPVLQVLPRANHKLVFWDHKGRPVI
jgi:hypothetical protein